MLLNRTEVASRLTRWSVVHVAAVVAALLAVTVAPVSATHASEEGPPLATSRVDALAALDCPSGFTNTDKQVVLLVHATGVTGPESWPDGLGIVLTDAGFDWCMVSLPGRALVDAQTSSEYVVHSVRWIHEETSRRVSLVGWSQGAMENRWAVRWWPDVQSGVSDVITMQGANNGLISGSGLCALGQCAPAVWQFSLESKFMAALNSDPVMPEGPAYTAITSLTDTFVLPAEGSIQGNESGNVLVQDLCPTRPVEHVQSIFDAAYLAIVMDALRHPGPADLNRIDPAVCEKLYAPGIDPITANMRIVELYSTGLGNIQDPANHVSQEPPLRDYAQ